MKLIDKDAVLAEIEKLKDEALEYGDKSRWFLVAALAKEINSLEVKEVDIEKEVIDWWNAHYSSKAYTFEGYTGHYVENSTLIEIAKHFFELGLKAQKGE